EGNPGGGGACTVPGKLGPCANSTAVCSGGALTCPQTVFASTEICNNVDDDCDGTVDDGNPGGGTSCVTGLPGVCAAGTTTCSGGSLTCDPNQSASPETCNGLDDDCDGQTDEDHVCCGNGRLDPGETCDDGNTNSNDCCSATCQRAPDMSPCSVQTACTLNDVCMAGVGRGTCNAGKTCGTGCGHHCKQVGPSCVCQ